jgi:NAD(P)-dependent dehydrogenase (short-subunit alcohol dehydrogenase family)
VELRAQFGEDRVTFVQCDVTKPEQFRRCRQADRGSNKSFPYRLFDECEAFFEVPCVDLVVNNAGINTNFVWKMCREGGGGEGEGGKTHVAGEHNWCDDGDRDRHGEDGQG